MEHKRCYVYESDDRQSAKKRRLDPPTGLHQSWPARRQHFEKSWSRLNKSIDSALAAVNNDVVKQTRHHLAHKTHERASGRIATCLVSIEPGSRARDALTDNILDLQADIVGQKRHVFMDASEVYDLKSALKKIVRGCGNSEHIRVGEDDENELEEHTVHNHRTHTLAYDLQAVADEYDDPQQGQCLLVISDAEACKPAVLSELIEYLALWLDRIPFALLICCAVPVEMLQRALTQGALRNLNCDIAHAASSQDEIETVLACMTDDEQWNLFIGPQLMRSFLQRQHDYLSDVTMFIASLKYASMCASYANPLLELVIAGDYSPLTTDLYKALRTTTSFKKLLSGLITEGDANRASELLTDNEKLQEEVVSHVTKHSTNLKTTFRIVIAIVNACRILLPDKEVFVTMLWLQCLSGTLKGSTTLRHLFLAIRKASHEVLVKALDAFHGVVRSMTLNYNEDEPFQPQCRSDCVALLKLIDSASSISAAREGDSTGKTTTSFRADAATLLEDIINSIIKTPKDLLFHEIFLYDSPSPCREVLTPRPRHAVERALASPHDYLDCTCCAPEQDADDAVAGSLSNTQPTTAVLYQLYLESGNMINVHDAWQAFNAILGDERDDEQKMALFQRSLAELRHLGMVKSTRRRVDHIAKTAWKGL